MNSPAAETKKQIAARLQREHDARNPTLFDYLHPSSLVDDSRIFRTIHAPEIDTPGAARVADPDTAKQAASKLPARAVENIVLHAIESAPDGLTSEEAAERTGLSLVTVSPRMRPLERQGKIFESVDRRKNKSGSPAIVWKSVGHKND